MARDPDDFYRTPPDALLALQSVTAGAPFFTLDPCAGDGGILAAQALIYGKAALQMRGVELDAERTTYARGKGLRVEQGDGLVPSWKGERVVLTPPFRWAQPFATKAATEADAAAVLLPLNYLSSGERSDWWLSLPPLRGIIVLSVRPSFMPDGSTANGDYAWFLWGDFPAHVAPVTWYRCPLQRKRRIELAAMSREISAAAVVW